MIWFKIFIVKIELTFIMNGFKNFVFVFCDSLFCLIRVKSLPRGNYVLKGRMINLQRRMSLKTSKSKMIFHCPFPSGHKNFRAGHFIWNCKIFRGNKPHFLTRYYHTLSWQFFKIHVAENGTECVVSSGFPITKFFLNEEIWRQTVFFTFSGFHLVSSGVAFRFSARGQIRKSLPNLHYPEKNWKRRYSTRF